ncbi:hypothetical protein DL98DRAFT_528291 [Cadophora sp. DSE1049]|nr:hypothetical protein DL98DRAFT_528291 [Cadophora sp. DSE1049]
MSSVVSSEDVQALIDKAEPNFALFPKLPLELRHMVWKYALPGPRTIEIFYKDHLRPLHADSVASLQRPKISDPVILFANKESREVALSAYELAFHYRTSSPLYFDFKPKKNVFSSKL